jgi:hypothetical protein
MTDQDTQGARVNRAEWGVVASIAISLLTAAFYVGFVYGAIQEHERRIVGVESKVDDIATRLERIDANVSFLAERAREDRERRR